MNRLRGTFTAQPFEQVATKLRPYFNPALGRKMQRLHRLKRKGLTPPSDKATLRQLATEAAASHPITRIPMGKTTR